MASKKMKPKALNLAEHKQRLASAGVKQGPGLAWGVAFLALVAGLLLLTLTH